MTSYGTLYTYCTGFYVTSKETTTTFDLLRILDILRHELPTYQWRLFEGIEGGFAARSRTNHTKTIHFHFSQYGDWPKINSKTEDFWRERKIRSKSWKLWRPIESPCRVFLKAINGATPWSPTELLFIVKAFQLNGFRCTDVATDKLQESGELAYTGI